MKTKEKSLSNLDKPLKIAVLSRRFVTTGGAERYSVEVARRLAQHHDVHVFSYEINSSLLENVTYHKLPWLIRKPRYISQLLYSWMTKRKLNSSFDIVYSHEMVSHAHVNVIHCQCFKTGQPNFTFSPRKMVYRWLEYHQIKPSSKQQIIAVSDFVKRNIQANYRVDSDRITLAFPAVDIAQSSNLNSKDALRQKIGLNNDDFVVLFVAHNFKKKGLDYLLKAVAELQQADLKLIVVGAGDRETYQKMTQQLNINSQVLFLGEVSEMAECYAIADLMVHPTLKDTCAMVAIEAMAAGVPVILSGARFNGLAERIQHGEAVIIDDPSDSRQLAVLIAALRNDEKRRELMQQLGKQLAQLFTWDETVKQTLIAFDKVLACKE